MIGRAAAERPRRARRARRRRLAPDGRLFFAGLIDYLWEREQ